MHGHGNRIRFRGRRQQLGDEHSLHPSPKPAAVDAVAIAEEIARRRVFGERLDELLRGQAGVLHVIVMGEHTRKIGVVQQSESLVQSVPAPPQAAVHVKVVGSHVALPQQSPFVAHAPSGWLQAQVDVVVSQTPVQHCWLAVETWLEGTRILPLCSVPPRTGPPEMAMVKMSPAPRGPLSVTLTAKVQGTPLFMQVPAMMAVLPMVTSEVMPVLRTSSLTA